MPRCREGLGDFLGKSFIGSSWRPSSTMVPLKLFKYHTRYRCSVFQLTERGRDVSATGRKDHNFQLLHKHSPDTYHVLSPGY